MLQKVLIFLICITFPLITNASPSPQGIAINQETKKCSEFWPGDEFYVYNLPNNWKAYYFTPSINTPFGDCLNFKSGQEKECCEKLGLTYIENLEITKTKTEFYKKLLTSKVKTNTTSQINNNTTFFWFPLILPLLTGVLYIGFRIAGRRKK